MARTGTDLVEKTEIGTGRTTVRWAKTLAGAGRMRAWRWVAEVQVSSLRMSSPSQALLSEIEGLHHRARVRRMIALGREARQGDERAASIVAELHASASTYERLMALYSAFGHRDGARVAVSVHDASRMIRRVAASMVAELCDDAQVEAALTAIVEPRLVCSTLNALVRRRRGAVVDCWLTARLRAGVEPKMIDLLPFAGQGHVEAFLGQAVEHGGTVLWGRLCRRHPELAVSWFRGELARRGSIDPRLRWRILAHLKVLAERVPDAALELVRALLAADEPVSALASGVQRLVRARPGETFDVLRAHHQRGPERHPPGVFAVAQFDKVAHLLGAERLDFLVRHAWSALGDGTRGRRWFLRLSESDRAAVLAAFVAGNRGGWGAFLFRYLGAESPQEIEVRERAYERFSRAAQDLDGTIPVAVLDWLPLDLREREATRHLERCQALSTRPRERIAYAGLLPFARAKEVLAPWLGHPEGEERARAQMILIGSVRHDRAAMGDALANVKARRFEQDPVRRSMFEALVDLRVALFAPEHLALVADCVTDALDAADLSSATAAAVERLICRLFRLDGEWGANQLSRLLATRGSVSTWGLGEGLTRADAERLTPALARLAHEWTDRERAGAVITLAASLGIRLGAVTPVLEALDRLARELPFAGVAAAALELLAVHDRRRFCRIVPELLRDDPSFVLISRVARFVSLQRQDLLVDALLSAQPLTGRFATGRTFWVIDYERGHGRCTAYQQQVYARGCFASLRDQKSDVPTMRVAINNFVRLAFADAAPFLAFAADPRQPVREMTIRALPWLDARQGLPALIDALGDDRARWAIYALRKVFSEMPRAEVLATLRGVPVGKVTVAKEVARLLGELRGDDAYAELLRMDRAELHRDVRIALLRALWDHLDRPETWTIFERAVEHPDWIVGSKLAEVPLDRLTTDTEGRVVALLAKFLARPEPEARLDLLRRSCYLPLADARRELFRRLLAHLAVHDPDEAAAALRAVLYRMRPGEAADVAVAITAALGRRRHLPALLRALGEDVTFHRSKAKTRIAEAVLLALKNDTCAVAHYLSFGSRVWTWRQLGAAVIELAEGDLLHYDALAEAINAARQIVRCRELEELLRPHPDWRVRRVALAALVASAAPKNGWTRTRRALLAEYCQDPHPGVAGPANFAFPP